MHPSKLIANAKNKLIKINDKELDYEFYDGDEKGECLICGIKTEKGFKRKDVIKQTFTNWQDCKNKESDVVCENCSFPLYYKTFRYYSIYADKNKCFHPILKEFKETILNAEPPFIFCIAVSGQKHIFLKSKVATSTSKMCVNLEETPIYFSKNEFIYLMEKVEFLYNHECKFTKEEIKTFNFAQHKIINYGIDNFMNLMYELEKYRNSKLLELCVHIAQKKEEV